MRTTMRVAGCRRLGARSTSHHAHRMRTPSCSSKPNPPEQDPPKPGLGLKAAWYGAEQLGNIIGALNTSERTPSTAANSSAAQPTTLSRADAIAAIRADYDDNYFVSGQGDLAAYAPTCRFADPFASFRGVQRFKNNVSNLGALMEDVDLTITDWQELDDRLVTKWRFRCILQLPWRPVLAAAGGTQHVFDPVTGQVVDHIESWDVEPGKVLRALLKPSAAVPSTAWEVAFAALYAGDPWRLWLAVHRAVLVGVGVIAAFDILVQAAMGGELHVVWWFVWW